MSLFVFLVEKGAINSTYATVAWMKGHPKCEQLRIEGWNVTPYVPYGLTLSLFMFFAAFVPYVVLFYMLKFNVTFIQKRYEIL